MATIQLRDIVSRGPGGIRHWAVSCPLSPASDIHRVGLQAQIWGGWHPLGRAKLLLSRQPGDARPGSSGSAGASPQCCEHDHDHRETRSDVPVSSRTSCERQPGGDVVDNSWLRYGRVLAAKNSKNAKQSPPPFAFFEFFAAIPPVCIHALHSRHRSGDFPISSPGNRHVGHVSHAERIDLHPVHSTGLALPAGVNPKIQRGRGTTFLMHTP